MAEEWLRERISEWKSEYLNVLRRLYCPRRLIWNKRSTEILLLMNKLTASCTKTFNDLCLISVFYCFYSKCFIYVKERICLWNVIFTVFYYVSCVRFPVTTSRVSEGLAQWTEHTGKISVWCDVVFNLYFNEAGNLKSFSSVPSIDCSRSMLQTGNFL